MTVAAHDAVSLNDHRISGDLRAALLDAVRRDDPSSRSDAASLIAHELEAHGLAADPLTLIAQAQEFAATLKACDHLQGSPVLLDLRELAQREPPPPRFIVENWLPEGEATLFAGHGGTGKSLLALTAAVCIAAGNALFGLRCDRRRVLFLSYEDSESILHWRLRRVCDMLGVDLAALDGWLFVFDASATGHPLYNDTHEGGTPSAAMNWLREQVAETRAQVLVLDGTADAFAGNENNRAQVREFVQALRRLMPSDGGLLLLHHVDAASAHSSSSKGYSGSTAWHNSCRARWYLKPTEEGDDADPSRVSIELRKSNHGKPGATLALRFSDVAGCFIPDENMPASGLTLGLRDADEREAVLRLIADAEAKGDPIPTATRGERSAHRVAVARGLPPSLRGKRDKARFYDHLEALRDAGAVRVGSIKRPNRNYLEVYRAASCATERASATEQGASATEQLS